VAATIVVVLMSFGIHSISTPLDTKTLQSAMQDWLATMNAAVSERRLDFSVLEITYLSTAIATGSMLSHTQLNNSEMAFCSD
jgi:hypothetical protein